MSTHICFLFDLSAFGRATFALNGKKLYLKWLVKINNFNSKFFIKKKLF